MKRYAIVIERAASNYGGYVPDLPGCVATGSTVEETERMLRQAIEMHLEGMREDGIPGRSRPAKFAMSRSASER